MRTGARGDRHGDLQQKSVAELERKMEGSAQRGFYEHLKGAVSMEGMETIRKSSVSGTKMAYC